MIQKIISALASLLLASGMLITPVYAQDDAEDYSITITNAIDGVTYTAYKLFDAQYVDEETVTYTISANSPFYDTLVNSGQFELNSTLDPDVYSVVIEEDHQEQLAWLKETMANEINEDTFISELASAWETADGSNEVTIDLNDENLGAGYYFVKSGSSYDSGSAITLTNVVPEAVIEEKSVVTPTPVSDNLKSVNRSTANRNDKVTYTMSFIAYNYVMNNGVSTAVTSYDIEDISKGLDIQKDTVTIAVQEWQSGKETAEEKPTSILNATVEVNLINDENSSDYYEQQMTIHIPWKDTYPSRAKVTITYQAILKTNENLYTAENTAQIRYNNSIRFNTNEQQVQVHSYGIEILKTDEFGEPLEGAKFLLYKANSDGSMMDESIPVYKDEDGNYTTDWTVTGAASEEKAKANDSTTIDVDEEGYALIYGLEDTNETDSSLADYYLEEVEAPTGYNLLFEPKEVILDTENGNEVTGVSVENQKGSLLPSTGGAGTTLIYLAGILCAGTAVIFLITNRKVKNQE